MLLYRIFPSLRFVTRSRDLCGAPCVLRNAEMAANDF